MKRRGEIDGVEQLTRYLELMRRDPLLGAVRGSSPRSRSSRRPGCWPRIAASAASTVDYDVLRGMDDPSSRLF